MSATSIAARVLGLAMSVAALGCQTYDFEPVEPLAIAQTTQEPPPIIAKKPKPNLMLLVDKSGSMDLPSDLTNPSCPAGCGVGKSNLCPTASCPTRWSELQSAMGTFLQSNGTVARMGMAAYPTNDTCGAATDVRVQLETSENDDPAALQAKADAILADLQGITSQGAPGTPTTTGGGTPTGPSLAALADYAPLQDEIRDDFILLLTDGLPNCNPSNPNNMCAGATNPNGCRCTLSGGCTGSFCSLGCLDKDGSVTQVAAALREKGIKTIVVGFGADTQGQSGQEVLNAMALAGGFQRTCPNGTNEECGTDNTCNTVTRVCQNAFYQATSATELAAALAEISRVITSGDLCEFALEATPSDPAFLTVIVNGAAEPAGPDTWRYEAGKVIFQGAMCDRFEAATPQNPVNVEFRIVQAL